MDETAILIKLGKIEEDISEIQKYLINRNEKSRVLKLGGVLKNIEIAEEDISKAKKSIFQVPNDL